VVLNDIDQINNITLLYHFFIKFIITPTNCILSFVLDFDELI